MSLLPSALSTMRSVPRASRLSAAFSRAGPLLRPTQMQLQSHAHAQATAPAPSSSSSPLFFSTSIRCGADPAKNRNNSEGTMPGAGSTDDIADSEGAFSGGSPRPDQSAKEISKEKPGVEMDSSAASNDNADRSASEGNKETTKSASGTNPPASKENLGASRARKEKKQQ